MNYYTFNNFETNLKHVNNKNVFILQDKEYSKTQ